MASALYPTHCAICGTEGTATELYPANFSDEAFTEAIFSARRLPDGIHYRLVKCNKCGLVRSDPVAAPDSLAKLYQRSIFTYGDELPDLKYTYGRYLRKLEMAGVNKGTLLEIGGGNGFFLEIALSQGYKAVKGIEPSAQAISQASPLIQPFMICDIIRPDLIEPHTIDVICIFQVFDHLTNPGGVLDECRRILKPQGMILIFNHNVEALSARLLGKQSPIIDIEHTYLYNLKTMAQILQDHHFNVKEIGPAFNRYGLSYLARLFPLPKALKMRVLSLLKHKPFSRIKLSVPLGNLYVVGQTDYLEDD